LWRYHLGTQPITYCHLSLQTQVPHCFSTEHFWQGTPYTCKVCHSVARGYVACRIKQVHAGSEIIMKILSQRQQLNTQPQHIIDGSHVFNSSTESVCRGVSVERFFAEPKVCEHHVSLAIQHYVLRFQVPAREREREERER
jgi:hypothetical protein